MQILFKYHIKCYEYCVVCVYFRGIESEHQEILSYPRLFYGCWLHWCVNISVDKSIFHFRFVSLFSTQILSFLLYVQNQINFFSIYIMSCAVLCIQQCTQRTMPDEFQSKICAEKKAKQKKMVLKKYELRVEISKIVKFRTISIIFNSTDNLMWWQQGIAFTRNMLAKETHTFISVNDLIFNSNASFFFFNKNKHIIRFSIVILINWCLRCASKRRKNLFFLFSNCCKSLNFCFQYFSFVVLICVLSIKKKMRIFGWRLYKAKKSLRYTSRLFLLLSFSKNQTKYQS